MSSWQHVAYGLCLKCRRSPKFTPVVGVRISERGREITSRTFGMFSLYLSYPYVNWFIVQGYLFNGYFEREQGEPFPFPLLEHFSSGYHPRQSPTSATQFPIHSEKDLSNVNANPDRGTVSKLLRLPARTVPRLISLVIRFNECGDRGPECMCIGLFLTVHSSMFHMFWHCSFTNLVN